MCVKFCFKLGKTFVDIFELLKHAYGEECKSRTQCYEWFKRFKEGRTSVSEDSRPGRLSTSRDNRYVMRVCEVIHENRRLTVWKVTEEVGISAKFVPRLLTGGQKENRVSISQDMLANAYDDENFLKTFFLFPTLKTTLKGHRFQDTEEVKENATRQLCCHQTKCIPGSILKVKEALAMRCC